MFDLLDLPPVTDRAAAAEIAGSLAAGTPITRRDLNAAMTAAFGGSDADGRWTQRDSFEMLEHAVALHLASRPYQIANLADVHAASAVMQLLLDWNQLAWAVEFPSGDYEEIRLNLSAQCPARAGTTTTFSQDRYAKLWDPAERMPFVFAAADRLDELLKGSAPGRVEESLRAISTDAVIA